MQKKDLPCSEGPGVVPILCICFGHSKPSLHKYTFILGKLNGFHEKEGNNQGALVDLVSVVAYKFFTNYIHYITNIPIDFPLAPKLEETVTVHLKSS